MTRPTPEAERWIAALTELQSKLSADPALTPDAGIVTGGGLRARLARRGARWLLGVRVDPLGASPTRETFAAVGALLGTLGVPTSSLAVAYQHDDEAAARWAWFYDWPVDRRNPGAPAPPPAYALDRPTVPLPSGWSITPRRIVVASHTDLSVQYSSPTGLTAMVSDQVHPVISCGEVVGGSCLRHVSYSHRSRKVAESDHGLVRRHFALPGANERDLLPGEQEMIDTFRGRLRAKAEVVHWFQRISDPLLAWDVAAGRA